MTDIFGHHGYLNGFLMHRLKISFLYPFRNGAWGGSNQFLKALQIELRARDLWVDQPQLADVLIFDSFNMVASVVYCKLRNPRAYFIHRIDGPVSIYRGRDENLDRLVYEMSEAIADGVVFQSDYSRSRNISLGMEPPPKSVVIHNAASPVFFCCRDRTFKSRNINIIAASWSSNINKGFDVYSFLDDNLNFNKYTFTFVGNSPRRFKNIVHLPPQSSLDLAKLLNNADIYLTASRHESCSNSLLEALACELPVVAIDSGSNKELLMESRSGAIFGGTNDVIQVIDRVSKDLDFYRPKGLQRDLSRVADDYIGFILSVIAERRPPKLLSISKILRILGLIFYNFQLRLFERAIRIFAARKTVS